MRAHLQIVRTSLWIIGLGGIASCATPQARTSTPGQPAQPSAQLKQSKSMLEKGQGATAGPTTPSGKEFSLPGLASWHANPKILPEVRSGFGRLVGAWNCDSESRQPDGSFKADPHPARWTFFYSLNGKAIADLWEPAAASGQATGLNLRIYRPETKDWTLGWATHDSREFLLFTAVQDGDNLVMRGQKAATKVNPAHHVRITFFETTPESFRWRYEAAMKPEGPWNEVVRMQCRAVAQ